MRNIILSICLLLVCSLAQASVRPKFISKEKTPNNYIKICFQFIDDKETGDVSDDEILFGTDCRLWEPQQFVGKTNAERKAMVYKDLKHKMEGNIFLKYVERKEHPSDELRRTYIDTVFDALPESALNQFTAIETVEVNIDKDGDGTNEETWTIKPDGTSIRINN